MVIFMPFMGFYALFYNKKTFEVACASFNEIAHIRVNNIYVIV